MQSSRVVLLVRAQDVSEAIVRAAVPTDDAAVVAFEQGLGPARLHAEHTFEMQTDDGVMLWVMRRRSALTLVASITGDDRSSRLLDVVGPACVPVVVVRDGRVCVGAFDPRRLDGGWDEGNAGLDGLAPSRLPAGAFRCPGSLAPAPDP
jgi:hypothetical protein